MINDDLFSLGISVCQSLIGSKRAVCQGNTIYVSPAIYELIRHANERELRLLLEKIEYITIPTIDFSLQDVMTTKPFPAGNMASLRATNLPA